MTHVELFVQKIFGVDLTEKQLHFQNTSDRTLWYKVKHATRTMYVPGMNVLRINPMELDRFIGFVDSLLHFGIDSPMYRWDNLNLYEYHGEEEVEAGLRLLIGNYSHALMGVDIETRDVSWDNNKLLAIGFAVDDDTCLAFYDIPQHLYPLLEKALNMPGATYAWHNGKFDCEHLWYTCSIKAHVDEDTMLKHYVQISEKKGSHGLKELGPIYLQAPQWDDELDAYKKKWCRERKIKIADFKYDMIPTNILIPYMQRDCIATRRLLTVFEQLKEEGTDWIYRQLIRASNTFRCIECNGATVDQEHLAMLDKELSADLQAATEDVNESIAYFWNPVAYSKETGAKYKEEFSLKSPKQLKWLLSKATGMQLESTDAATIDKLVEIAEEGVVKFDQHTIKLLEGIKRSRKASKYLDTYVTGIRNVLCSDGKVRANYNLHGTETGRLSSSNPNAQNIPRDKKIKNIFKAPKGYKLVQLDYSQAELRVLGVLSNDPFLIKSYIDDKDLHANVAEEIFGPDFTKEQRTQCKTINFGIAYGRGAGAIAQAFHMPKAEAQKIIDDWFKAMPKVKEYIQGQRAAARRGERQQTMFGRVRHYVINDENMFHVENEYINTPIQSIASDMTLFSLMEINDWLIKEGLYDPWDADNSDVRIAITVHDSIVLEVRDDDALVEHVARKCQEVMAGTPQKYIENCPLPFKADAEIGYSWGKLEEF